MSDPLYQNGRFYVFGPDKDGDTLLGVDGDEGMHGIGEDYKLWMLPGEVRKLIEALRKSINGGRA